MRLRDARLELGLAAAIFAFNLLFLGHFGLLDVDEAIFAECTREMIVSGDFVTPRYNGDLRWDKPPLTYWLMSVPMRLAGPTAFGARAWSAAAGALCALLLMLYGRLLWDRASGLAAGVVMASCLHGFALAHLSITDMTLAWLMAGGWLALGLGAETGRARWFALAGVALGLATLTKGPVAIVLPGGSWLVWLVFCRRLGVLARPAFWLGPALCGLLVAPWCVAIYQLHGPAFFETFLGYHNVNRLTTTQSGHGGPWFTYLLLLAAGLLPWTGFAVAGLADAWRGRSDGAGGRAAWLALCGAGCTVLLFSASRTKLPNYIAPAYPLLALLAGRVAAEAACRPRAERRWRLLWFLNLGGYVGLGAALASLPLWADRAAPLRRLAEGELGLERLDTGLGSPLAGLLMLTLAAPPVILWARRRFRAATLALAGAGLAGGLALWLGVGPVIYHYQQGTPRIMGQVASALAANREQLATLNVHLPSLAFNTRRLFTRITLDRQDPRSPGELAARFAAAEPLYLLTRDQRAGNLLPRRFCYDWGRRHGWRLVSNRPPPADWSLPPSPWREAQAAALENGR